MLDLDRPIGEYVSELPAAWRAITARMLVHHTSGIAHYADERDGLDSTYFPTTRAALSQFETRPLVHAPGQQEILQSLGMPNTGPDLQSAPPPERTGFYSLAEDGSVTEAPFGTAIRNTARTGVQRNLLHLPGECAHACRGIPR